MDSLRSADAGRPTSPTLSDLAVIASQLDVTLHLAHLEDGLLGLYEPTEARVYFTFGLTPVEERAVIAHELGHVFYGHECDGDRNEREADTWAAQMLIDATAYAEAERHSHSVHDLADALGVTEDLVAHYRAHCMQRLGRRTYGRQARGRFTNAIARGLSD